MNKILIILAGGASSRFSTIGNLLPKSLVPLANETIIERILRHANFSNFNKTVISCNPDNYSVFQKFFTSKKELYSYVNLFKNENHKEGPINALLYIASKFPNSRFVIVLADIYFLENPFKKIQDTLVSENTYLWGSLNFNQKELEEGGIIFIDSMNNVVNIIKEPIPGNKMGMRWNGSITTDSNNLVKLQESFLRKLKSQKDMPLEYMFKYFLDNGMNIKLIETPDFVNNNTPKDLLLSSLYNSMESASFNSEVNSDVINIADYFRNKILHINK